MDKTKYKNQVYTVTKTSSETETFCQNCNRMYRCRSSYINHMKLFHKIVIEDSTKIVNKKKLYLLRDDVCKTDRPHSNNKVKDFRKQKRKKFSKNKTTKKTNEGSYLVSNQTDDFTKMQTIEKAIKKEDFADCPAISDIKNKPKVLSEKVSDLEEDIQKSIITTNKIDTVSPSCSDDRKTRGRRKRIEKVTAEDEDEDEERESDSDFAVEDCETPGSSADETEVKNKNYNTRAKRGKKLFVPRFTCCSNTFSKRKQIFLHMYCQKYAVGGDCCDPHYVCSACSSKFKFYIDLYDHSRKQHMFRYPKYEYCCDNCAQIFNSFESTKKHQHKCTSVPQKSLTNIKGFSDLRTEFRAYGLYAPDETAPQDNFVIIVRSSSESQKQTCSKDNAKELICEICYDVFDDSAALLEHAKFHEEIKSSDLVTGENLEAIDTMPVSKKNDQPQQPTKNPRKTKHIVNPLNAEHDAVICIPNPINPTKETLQIPTALFQGQDTIFVKFGDSTGAIISKLPATTSIEKPKNQEIRVYPPASSKKMENQKTKIDPPSTKIADADDDDVIIVESSGEQSNEGFASNGSVSNSKTSSDNPKNQSIFSSSFGKFLQETNETPSPVGLQYNPSYQDIQMLDEAQSSKTDLDESSDQEKEKYDEVLATEIILNELCQTNKKSDEAQVSETLSDEPLPKRSFYSNFENFVGSYNVDRRAKQFPMFRNKQEKKVLDGVPIAKD